MECGTLSIQNNFEDVFSEWEIEQLIDNLNITQEEKSNLEKKINSSIIEILQHEAFVRSKGRVTTFTRVTPESQIVARNSLISNRLDDALNGKFLIFQCYHF